MDKKLQAENRKLAEHKLKLERKRQQLLSELGHIEEQVVLHSSSAYHQ